VPLILLILDPVWGLPQIIPFSFRKELLRSANGMERIVELVIHYLVPVVLKPLWSPTVVRDIQKVVNVPKAVRLLIVIGVPPMTIITSIWIMIVFPRCVVPKYLKGIVCFLRP